MRNHCRDSRLLHERHVSVTHSKLLNYPSTCLLDCCSRAPQRTLFTPVWCSHGERHIQRRQLRLKPRQDSCLCIRIFLSKALPGNFFIKALPSQKMGCRHRHHRPQPTRCELQKPVNAIAPSSDIQARHYTGHVATALSQAFVSGAAPLSFTLPNSIPMCLDRQTPHRCNTACLRCLLPQAQPIGIFRASSRLELRLHHGGGLDLRRQPRPARCFPRGRGLLQQLRLRLVR